MFMPPWPKNINLNAQADKFDKMGQLLNKLGNPHLKLPPIVHVAGSNGKGSTIAFLQAILNSAGYKVHRFISPHLLEVNERIVVGNHKISDELLLKYLERVRLGCEEVNYQPGFFEAMLATAFLAFSENEADITLIEVGIGGKNDITNIIENPVLSIITSISNDHKEMLGPTIEDITKEKAGIIKAGVPCISALQNKNIIDILAKRCHDLNSPSYFFGCDFTIEVLQNGFEFISKAQNFLLTNPALKGEHQYINAATAIAACQWLKDFKINESHIVSGIGCAHWPGRLQKLRSKTLEKIVSPRAEMWIDGAHNIAGCYALKSWLERNNTKEKFLIIGMTKGRNIMEIIEPIINHFTAIICVRVESEPSSYSAEVLKENIQAYHKNVQIADSIEEAIKIISYSATTINYLGLITGSLYLASDVTKYFHNKEEFA